MLCEEWRREPAPEDDRRGPALMWVFARVTSLEDRDRSRGCSGDGGEPKEGFLRMPDSERSQLTGQVNSNTKPPATPAEHETYPWAVWHRGQAGCEQAESAQQRKSFWAV